MYVHIHTCTYIHETLHAYTVCALLYFILKIHTYCRAREEKLKKEIEDASAAKVPLVQ